MKNLLYLALTIIAISLFALTIGQWLPVEFADEKVEGYFYIGLWYSLPVAVLLTLFRTVKKNNPKSKNAGIIIGTSILAAGSFFLVLWYYVTFMWGSWIDETIAYRDANNADHTINVQLYDIGGCGYGGKRRVAELTPLTPLFHFVTVVDTTAIDKSQWRRVNEQGDLKWP